MLAWMMDIQAPEVRHGSIPPRHARDRPGVDCAEALGGRVCVRCPPVSARAFG